MYLIEQIVNHEDEEHLCQAREHECGMVGITTAPQLAILILYHLNR